ncbi:TetR/AcrR family transcriptional regulator [Acetoanaerobium noterae]|uniref:TetR/AcrR family transcriptional regulator n=1 Tax=Acetoanaerobium noterae TaxID=745369 RepID=UPI0028AF07A7|nr:TetR/AcrR family transcriptional regulator [Acetoanaerobium noterae]
MRSFYNDERVIKTKKLIKTALSELIQEKGFDHVSITDLTQRANINRGTFYLHYQDKYDLLEKFENEVLDDINTNAENFIKSIKDIDFLGEDFSNEIKPFINKIFTYIKENYIIMKVILGPKSDMRFQNKIKKALNILLTEKGWDNYFDSQNTFVSKNYFISYLVSAHIGVIRQWIDSGMNESAENMAEMISKMFFLGPFNSIKNK